MDPRARTGRRALVGVAMMTVGAVVGVAGLTTPAGAHDTKDEPDEVPGGLECPDVAPDGTQWLQTIIDGIPVGEDHTETVVLSDRGTEDTGDDATVTVEIEGGKEMKFTANVGIDAVLVEGSDTELQENSYLFFYTEDGSDEVTSDHDLQTPPYNDRYRNHIKTVTFCWDDEHEGPPSTPPSTEPEPTTSAPTTSSSTTSSTSTSSTSTSVAPSAPSSTNPPTTTPAGDLPQTGSNTGMLVGIGAALLLAGAILVATTRQLWRRHGPAHLG